MPYIGTTEIGVMLLGTNWITEAYLGDNLVFQGPLPDNYVKNGLVLWLDGVDKGSTTSWVDRVSGETFTNNGAVFGEDYVQFSGRTSNLSNSTFTPPASANGTIEAVIQCDSDADNSQLVFMPKSGGSYMALGLFSGNRTYMNGASTPKRYPYEVIPPTTATSASFSDARGYINGVSATRMDTNDSYLAYPDTVNYIGNRKSSNAAPFKGKIYSIRIYNRQLSETEMRNNLMVDNARFNLGLTL